MFVFPGGLDGKASVYNAGDLSSITGSGRFHMQQMQLIPCTTTIEPSSRARGATVRENTTMESSRTITEYLSSLQLGKANAKQGRSSTAINNKQKDHLKKIKKCVCVCYLLSRVWLCNLMDCSPSGSSVHGLLQGRILEWIAIPFSRGSSQPSDRTRVSYMIDLLLFNERCLALKLTIIYYIWASPVAHW